MWRRKLAAHFLSCASPGDCQLAVTSASLVRALKKPLAYATSTNGTWSRHDVILAYDREFKRFESVSAWMRGLPASGSILTSPLRDPPNHMPWMKPFYDLWYSPTGYPPGSWIEEGRAALEAFSETCAALQRQFRVAPAAADVLAALLSSINGGTDSSVHLLVQSVVRFSGVELDARRLGSTELIAAVLDVVTLYGIVDIPDGTEPSDINSTFLFEQTSKWPSVDRCLDLCQLSSAQGAFAVVRRLIVGLPDYAFSNQSLPRTVLLVRAAVSSTMGTLARMPTAAVGAVIHNAFDLREDEELETVLRARFGLLESFHA